MTSAFEFGSDMVKRAVTTALYDYCQAQYCLDKLETVDTSNIEMRLYHLKAASDSLLAAEAGLEYVGQMLENLHEVLTAQQDMVSMTRKEVESNEEK